MNYAHSCMLKYGENYLNISSPVHCTSSTLTMIIAKPIYTLEMHLHNKLRRTLYTMQRCFYHKWIAFVELQDPTSRAGLGRRNTSVESSPFSLFGVSRLGYVATTFRLTFRRRGLDVILFISEAHPRTATFNARSWISFRGHVWPLMHYYWGTPYDSFYYL